MKQNPCSHRAYNLVGAGGITDPHINKKMQVSGGDKCWEGKKKTGVGKQQSRKAFLLGDKEQSISFGPHGVHYASSSS